MAYDWMTGRHDGQQPRSDADPEAHSTEIMREIARIVVTERVEVQKLSRPEVAKLAKVSVASLRNIEHGRHVPSVTMAEAVLDALGYRLTVEKVRR